MQRLNTSLLLTLLLACSAPAQIRDLREAEAYEAQGQHENALQSYRQAQQRCTKLGNKRRRRNSCAAAHLQYAELLVTLRRPDEALHAYHRAEETLHYRKAEAAQACYDAALIYLKQGKLESAYRYLWRTVTNYPNEAFAADALKRILQDGRRRAPKQLHRELLSLERSLAKTRIADNLLYALAQLEELEFAAPLRARQHYDALVERYRRSGLYDDSLWHSARLSRQLRDFEGAVSRLRKLTATREVAFGAGSYFSVWLDDAQYQLGLVLRHDLKDYSGSIRAFSKVSADYPASVLRDDALFQRAQAKSQAGQRAGACQDLLKLSNKYPDSKYNFGAAPQLHLELGCHL